MQRSDNLTSRCFPATHPIYMVGLYVVLTLISEAVYSFEERAFFNSCKLAVADWPYDAMETINNSIMNRCLMICNLLFLRDMESHVF